MTFDEKLAHSLKLQFGLASSEPNAQQLKIIKAAIATVAIKGRRATNKDWRDAVATACPEMGRHKYSDIDNSDLNTLLAIADFKAVLASTLGIVKWDPSEGAMITIARRVASTQLKSLADLIGIVVEVYPNALFLNLEGIDNSDLRTLLALATAAAAKV
ncbi:MAG: hypothetical protein RR311_00590 [Comamonas sp.]